MTNIENKVDGVRLSPEDLGGERQFSIVLEALREVHDKRKKSLSQYIQDLHDEYARKFNVPVRSKLALLYSAKSVLEAVPHPIAYNPSDEGLYLARRPA